MCKAFPFRRSREATLDENLDEKLIERRLNLRLILAMGFADFGWIGSRNNDKTHQPGRQEVTG
jgi:hypothetical protein